MINIVRIRQSAWFIYKSSVKSSVYIDLIKKFQLSSNALKIIKTVKQISLGKLKLSSLPKLPSHIDMNRIKTPRQRTQENMGEKYVPIFPPLNSPSGRVSPLPPARTCVFYPCFPKRRPFCFCGTSFFRSLVFPWIFVANINCYRRFYLRIWLQCKYSRILVVDESI